MLLWKEIKKTVLSITFAVFIIFLLAFAISQEVLNFSNEIITVPQQGEDYRRLDRKPRYRSSAARRARIDNASGIFFPLQRIYCK